MDTSREDRYTRFYSHLKFVTRKILFEGKMFRSKAVDKVNMHFTPVIGFRKSYCFRDMKPKL
jgi:hypothetical protein